MAGRGVSSPRRIPLTHITMSCEQTREEAVLALIEEAQNLEELCQYLRREARTAL